MMMIIIIKCRQQSITCMPCLVLIQAALSHGLRVSIGGITISKQQAAHMLKCNIVRT